MPQMEANAGDANSFTIAWLGATRRDSALTSVSRPEIMAGMSPNTTKYEMKKKLWRAVVVDKAHPSQRRVFPGVCPTLTELVTWLRKSMLPPLHRLLTDFQAHSLMPASSPRATHLNDT